MEFSLVHVHVQEGSVVLDKKRVICEYSQDCLRQSNGST